MWKREYWYKYWIKKKTGNVFLPGYCYLSSPPSLLSFSKDQLSSPGSIFSIIFLLLASAHTTPISQQDHYSLLMSIISEQFLVLLFLGLSGTTDTIYHSLIPLPNFGLIWFLVSHSLLVFLYYVFSAFLWPPLPLRGNT